MTEQLYPKANNPRRTRRGKNRRYRVHYEDLVVEGGRASWTGYHHTYVGARIAAWWNQYVGTYGSGTVTLEDTLEVPPKRLDSRT